MAQITIYTTPTCGYCKMAKEYFASKGLTWTEHDVMADRAKGEEMIKKTGQFGVPVIEVNGKVVVGFDQRKIDEYLAADAK